MACASLRLNDPLRRLPTTTATFRVAAMNKSFRMRCDGRSDHHARSGAFAQPDETPAR